MFLLLPLTVYNNVDSDAVVNMINLVSDGKNIFYDFYTDQKKQEDPTKETTGLFFFKGDFGAPFAVVYPGCGFSYVGSIHEGFPNAIELSKKRIECFRSAILRGKWAKDLRRFSGSTVLYF